MAEPLSFIDMRLRTYCKYCQQLIPIKSRGILLRTDLVDQYGDCIKIECKNCQKINSVEANKVFAKESQIPMILALIAGVTALIYGILQDPKNGWAMFYGIFVGASIISAGLLSKVNSSARSFNKYYI